MMVVCRYQFVAPDFQLGQLGEGVLRHEEIDLGEQAIDAVADHLEHEVAVYDALAEGGSLGALGSAAILRGRTRTAERTRLVKVWLVA